MDHAFAMRVFHGAANLDKQRQPFRQGTAAPVACDRDGQAVYVLHHEVGTALGGRARVLQSSDIRVLHERQRLSFRFETPQYRRAFQARLQHLQSHFAVHRICLFRKVDDPHAAFTDLANDFVIAECIAGLYARIGRRCQREQTGWTEGVAACVVVDCGPATSTTHHRVRLPSPITMRGMNEGLHNYPQFWCTSLHAPVPIGKVRTEGEKGGCVSSVNPSVWRLTRSTCWPPQRWLFKSRAASP